MNFKKITLILCAFVFLSAERNANAQSATFNYVSAATQTWAVPCGVTSATVQMWGAGGGSGWQSGYSDAWCGGSGAYMGGVLTGLTGGSTVLTLYVPSGGGYYTSNIDAPGGWPGGGNGGNDNSFSEYGGGGGGYAGIKIGATYYAIAGAGGGGGSTEYGGTAYGGGGGATTGGNGVSTEGTAATGGTLLAGGIGGTGGTLAGLNGAALTGGTGEAVTANGWYGGGGGGSGWFGGGGGGDQGNSGGGGSSYPGATFVSAGITFTISSNLQGTLNSSTVGSAVAPGGPPAGIGSGNIGGAGGNGCIKITWTLPIALSVVGHAVTNELCNAGNNASASETITGGTGPYTYLWTPTAQTTSNATVLTAGTYTIKVTDACGNSASSSVSITQPTAVAVTATTTANEFCNGENIGSASSTVSGGTGAYTYSWTGGGTNSTVSGLTAGTYTLTVTDNNGCTGTASATITQPAALSVAASTTTNVLCNGGNGGGASSTVSGGTGAYTYSWTGGGTNSTVSGLTAGTYTLTVTDANGCTGTASAAITQPAALTVTIDSTTNLLCNGANTGSATSIVGGGTSPYTYLWTGGGTNYKVTGLTAGTYTLTVTDANGCGGTATATITQPTAISLAHSSTPDNGSGNGTATVTASGGTSPYNYLWTPSGKTTAVITSEVHGTYCCTVTDANGCKDSVCVTINKGTGIDGITSNSGEIVVYPNPNNGQFTIKSSVGGASTVEIYNVLGEKVFTKSLSTTEGNNIIDISNQSSGVYLYRVISVTGDLLGEGKISLQK